MNIFRSEAMGYYHLVLPRESSWEVMNELGRLSMLHFIDQNPDMPNIQKAFTNYIKRCDEVLFKLNLIKKQMKVFNKDIARCENFKELEDHFNKTLLERGSAGQNYFEEIEDLVQQKTIQLDEQVNNYSDLRDKQDHLIEYKSVLKRASKILGPSFFKQNIDLDEEGSVGGESQSGLQQIDINQSQLSIAMRDFRLPVQHHGINLEANLKLNYIVGTISDNDASKFQKMIFRITKGNSWVMMENLDSSYSLNDLQASQSQSSSAQQLTAQVGQKGRSVFLMLIPGEQSGFVNQKIQRMCDAFGVNRYQFPENSEKYEKRLTDLDSQTRDSRQLLKLTKREINEFLDTFSSLRLGSNCSYIEELISYIEKEKLIYINLNYLKAQSTHYHGNCWLPKEEEENIMQSLQNIQKRYPHLPNGQLQEIIPARGTPPTFFKLNDFTRAFQQIVNTYGIPRYKEVNPGFFTIITFPFLFGVMFGDIGHGFLLFLLGAYLCHWKDYLETQKTSLLRLFLPARYLILLMGFFATYSGIIYDDFLSISLNWFGSCYQIEEVSGSKVINQTPNCTYAFGLDPVWTIAKNDLTFYNSFKMKLSVIIAIIHMSLGICMKAFNAVYFKSKVDFYFEFLPQILFIITTFGYMDFLIIVKWCTDWTQDIINNKAPPSIITLMIDIPLKGADPGITPIYGDGNGQKQIGSAFLIIAFVCVPLMLLPKPLWQYYQIKKRHQALHGYSDDHNQDKKYLMNDDVNISQKKQKSENSPHHSHHENNHSQGNGNLQEIHLDDLGKDLEQYQKNIDLHHGMNTEQINDEHNSGSDDHEGFSDLFVHQVIETIEFVLGSISNTASYLRLWALSLAHGQLSNVFFSKAMVPFIEAQSQVTQIVGLFIGYAVFAVVTFGVLMCMDVMECFLHALRLHWVEFQNKFYKADGYQFTPYSFQEYLKGQAHLKD